MLKIHYACSNWTVQRIGEAREYAQQKGYTGFVGNQMRWSIGTTHMRPPGDETACAMDQTTAEFHSEAEMAAIPYSSQAGGFFSKLSAIPETVAKNNYNTEDNKKLHRYLEAVSRDLRLTISQIVLAYFWSYPFATIPIVGCRNMEQLTDSLRAVGHRLPKEVMSELADTHGLPSV